MRIQNQLIWAAAMFSLACSNGVSINVEPEPMRRFDTEAELNGYLDTLKSQYESTGGPFGTLEDSAGGAPMANAAASGSGEPTNANITNNQEGAVDEGDIVKNVGEHLVILRKGRLYAAALTQQGAPVQTDSIRVAASDELNANVWYDEMLVKGSRVIVIGFRYLTDVQTAQGARANRIHGATEVNIFTLSATGEFTRDSSRFFESNDYYSSENYASRLANGKLILYMPYNALWYAGSQTTLPMPRNLHVSQGAKFVATSPLFTWNDVVRPVVAPDSPTFHSVMKCDITASGDLDCEARALLGDWSRQTYVSADRVFLWTDGYVYAISQQTLDVRVHAARGMPRNQLSFKQDADKLHVLASRSEQQGGAGSSYDQIVDLLSLPLMDFDALGLQPLDASNTAELSRSSSGYVSENRFADGWVVFSSVSWGGYYGQGTSSVVIARELHGAGTFAQNLSNTYVSRIEALPGTGALIVAREGQQLSLRTLTLGAQAQLQPPTMLASPGEAENRSHAFFFKPNGNGVGGTFGLPVLSGGQSGWWGRSESNVAFLRLDGQGGITSLGSVGASVAAGGQCETSCVDWYGNTRPLFLGSRVFALMGSELQEAQLTGSTVSDLGARLVLSF